MHPGREDLLAREWRQWRDRLWSADFPFLQLASATDAGIEEQSAKAHLVVAAALYLFEQDTVERHVLDTGRTKSAQKYVADLLNIEPAKVARFLGDLVERLDQDEFAGEDDPFNLYEQFMGAQPSDIRKAWNNKADMAAGIIAYVFDKDIYERVFIDWQFVAMRTFIKGADFTSSVVSLLTLFTTGSVFNDPVRRIGWMIANTLPRYPQLRELYIKAEGAICYRLADHVDVLAGYWHVDVSTGFGADLIAHLHPTLLGLESLQRMQFLYPSGAAVGVEETVRTAVEGYLTTTRALSRAIAGESAIVSTHEDWIAAVIADETHAVDDNH